MLLVIDALIHVRILTRLTNIRSRGFCNIWDSITYTATVPRLYECVGDQKSLLTPLSAGHSTGTTIRLWLKSCLNTSGGWQNIDGRDILPLLLVLRIVEIDTAEALSQIRGQLYTIQSDIHSDGIHEKWRMWQKYLTGLSERERMLGQCINSALTCMEDVGTTGTGTVGRLFRGTSTASGRCIHDKAPQSLKVLHRGFLALREVLKEMRSEVKETSNALTATMSIIESERAISEAGSVARLTELAFLFVPLSFSASIYGMQMKVSGWIFS